MAASERSTDRTEVRHLYKPERERRAWRDQEQRLLNVTRKLSADERILIYLHAERLALARITARLERKRKRNG